VNIGKRLVKSPKIYFMDTGLLCYLVGLQDAQHASAGPMGGAIFENLVASEIYKTIIHRGEEPQLNFWRTASGSEVDLILEAQGMLVPIEVKLSATPRPEMAREITRFRKDFGDKAGHGYVIHPGDTTLPLGEGNVAIPFAGI
jgi:predicted AAA+ superfamily ATPase